MQEALEHFDKSLSGLENLACALGDPADDRVPSTSNPSISSSSASHSGSGAKKEEKQCKKSREIILPVRYTFLSEQQIREVLLKWVSNKPSYRKSAARQMIFTVVNSVIVYLYRLETFSEKRSVYLQQEPYQDCVLDLPIKGWHMGLWDIPTAPTQMFTNEVKSVRIPHTDQIKTCPECHGTKCVPCCECHATGRVRCIACQGSGTIRLGLPCLVCHGRQIVMCMKCMGETKLHCSCCNGRGLTCYYQELKAEFRSTVHEHISTRLEVPRHLVATATGEILLDHNDRTVSPITTFSEVDINRVSRMFVRISRSIAGPDCRILRQRHHLKAIPFTSVYFRWRTEVGHFFLYGIEESIYCTEYPQRTASCLPLCR
ncbi:protein SSUH2 homolog [Ambystoma mexicanum]|uniref:protein SSUH2 homolog n=1 Tax=Ambystoma mexicanum TaxID=8296 RepID=UPI0037E988E1